MIKALIKLFIGLVILIIKIKKVISRGFKANCVNSKNKILELHSFFVQEMEVQNGTN